MKRKNLRSAESGVSAMQGIEKGNPAQAGGSSTMASMVKLFKAIERNRKFAL